MLSRDWRWAFPYRILTAVADQLNRSALGPSRLLAVLVIAVVAVVAIWIVGSFASLQTAGVVGGLVVLVLPIVVLRRSKKRAS